MLAYGNRLRSLHCTESLIVENSDIPEAAVSRTGADSVAADANKLKSPE